MNNNLIESISKCSTRPAIAGCKLETICQRLITAKVYNLLLIYFLNLFYIKYSIPDVKTNSLV